MLVNAGPEERAIAAEVVRASGGVAQAPEFTLERLIALTRRVCLVIAGDTGTVAPGLCAGQAGGRNLWADRPRRAMVPLECPSECCGTPKASATTPGTRSQRPALLTITPQQVVEAANGSAGEKSMTGTRGNPGAPHLARFCEMWDTTALDPFQFSAPYKMHMQDSRYPISRKKRARYGAPGGT